MHIFLISGEAFNGKDTLADILMKKLKGKSAKMSFAGYLKDIARKYYGWDGTKDDYGRCLLQYLGTERIREELGWEDFHVRRVCEDIKIIENDYDYILIPDARFRNEIYYTKSQFPDDVTSIHIERLNYKSPLTREQQNHKSENDLINFTGFDYEIKNEEGLDNLEKEADLKLGDLIKELNRVKYNTYLTN